MSQRFRIQLAQPGAVREVEARGSAEMQHFFELMRQGVAAIPGVPADALYDALTLRALALAPGVFEHVMLAEYHALKRGQVPARYKELIAVAVSRTNEGDDCVSCTPYHMGAARAEGAGEPDIAAAHDLDPAALPDPARAIVAFGLKCAFAPGQVSDGDIQAIKQLGYDDAAVVEIAMSALIAYQLSALNRIFNLGMDPAG